MAGKDSGGGHLVVGGEEHDGAVGIGLCVYVLVVFNAFSLLSTIGPLSFTFSGQFPKWQNILQHIEDPQSILNNMASA